MRRCKTQYWLPSLVNHCNIRYHMILYLCSDIAEIYLFLV
uniref:Uncharacterized protein n=1 Tax=Anguilla anguilla TaxID=7936 RepID=A0A0E9SCK8_ANGAN